ncbi:MULTISPECIES: MFS transporter [unclassified Mucilaginibacter]|uniref:MFS transporter n=1 Tax=unclassified Mucilaginibacter TaxID=2617802 RepID=UPI0009615F58|nr:MULTISPECIES: MFS transporter [unclassified Mucilaginibacter]OJW18444.1 MAG: MFS transporter [Mucilaginibacter sp. 44-25]PLW89614.1 MAG: MFS transporter [Mucilaginibacter sp.]HEK21894.1 MFS transporter [Bacteroidota bacterium]
MTEATPAKLTRNAVFLVLVASLGYFVDIYDLLVFSIVRVPSLTALGLSEADITTKGQLIINVQMAGLLLGGILWGIIGDKMGRIKVLFGSILLYSIANFANAYVGNVPSYAIIRFIAGIGLAGELGAGITLVSETLSKENRGYGTMIVAVIGLFGAAAAYAVAKHGWQSAYMVGGGLGILLLLLRVGTFESGMFRNVQESNVSKGNFLMLFNKWGRFKKYVYCILIGAPLWYVVGILVTLSPEFGKALGATETLKAGEGVLYTYIGIAIGDIFAGLLAQVTKSRRLTMLVFLVLSLVSAFTYLGAKGITHDKFVWVCFFMGCTVGYWATFVTIAAEQFGTNIRSTVTTTVPNFVRGSLIPINTIFNLLKPHYGMITTGYIMMIALTIISLFSLSQLKETFGKDLNYIEDEAGLS